VTIALRDALGVDVDDVPMTPEKVMAALEGRYRGPQMPAFDYPPTVVVPPLADTAPAVAPGPDAPRRGKRR